MKEYIIKNIDPAIGRRFKLHCVEIGITMREALLRLMDLEVEQRLLSCPIKEKEL